jgi:hypothetical protein
VSAKDKKEAGKTPAIRELKEDEIDSVSGGAAGRTTSWVEPDPQPVQSPKAPGWVDPDVEPKR